MGSPAGQSVDSSSGIDGAEAGFGRDPSGGPRLMMSRAFMVVEEAGLAHMAPH